MTDSSSTQFASMALGISSQEWADLGQGQDENVAASSILEVTVERVTALLMIRIVAWIQPRGKYTDLSTTCISRETLVPDVDSDEEDEFEQNGSWPRSMTPTVVAQLRLYVKTILSGYKTVPYHNVEHCYHVVISANKLMDMILNTQDIPKVERPPTFGFKDDPLMQLALIFAALIHDVEHQGIPNRQLSMEDNELAIQYNDQSIAEHRSLYIGFSELLKPEYIELRSVVFPQAEDYRRFRKGVVNLVLITDIASPERTQIGKSKWKEAFGDTYETVERKIRKQMERRNSQKSHKSSARGPSASPSFMPPKASRRMSTQSIMSELSLDGGYSDGFDHGMDEDESVSATPDTSDDEDERTPPLLLSPVMEPAHSVDGGPIFRPPKTHSPVRRIKDPHQTRHQSLEMGMSPPLKSTGSLSGMSMKFHRRLSNMGPGPAANGKQTNQRLGLRRTLDLSGEEIETYSHARNIRSSATGALTNKPFSKVIQPAEEVDELAESVVMEAILKAADVAHNLQSWDNMAKFSNRLFLELRCAYVQGRGEDPQNGWFSNQIGFLEGYLLPVARRLDDTGVFGDTIGAMFAQGVEDNRDRWTRDGMSLTQSIIREGDEMYPEDDSDDEGE
jgi:hypothetical protein